MPPLVLETGLVLTLLAGVIKVTTAINRLETQQRISHAELLGKHDVLKGQLDFIESESLELKQEIKDLRRRRHTDDTTGFG